MTASEDASMDSGPDIESDNPYRHLLFRYGYFASAGGELPCIQPGWDSWREAGFGITYDPATPFDACRQDGSFLLLLGHAVSLDSESTAHGELTRLLFDALLRSETEFLSQLDACCGRFVCFFSNGRGIRVLADATGMKMIHYTTTPWPAVASHVAILARIFEKKKSTAVETFLAAAKPATFNMAFLPGHATSLDGIRILSPNTYFDLCNGRTARFFPREELKPLPFDDAVGRASADLMDLMEKFSRVAPLAVSLTAGLDSRLTTAAAVRIQRDVLFFSYVRARQKVNIVDAIVAGRLAKDHDLRHMQLAFDYEASDSGEDRQDFQVFKAIASRTSDFEHFHPLAYAYIKSYPTGRLHVRSNIGEICRARYYTAPFESIVRSDVPEAKKLARIYNLWTRSAEHPFAEQEFERYLAETGLPTCSHGFDLPSLYYWEHLMPVWHGALLLESDLSHDTVCLFNCRRVLTTFLAMDFEAQRSKAGMLACIRTLWPALLDQPINPRMGDLWKTDVDAYSPSGPAPRLEVEAWRDGDTVSAITRMRGAELAGGAQYAFYLLAGAERIAMRWYTRDNEVAFDVPEAMRNATLAVRGFVRATQDHAIKFSSTATVMPMKPTSSTA